MSNDFFEDDEPIADILSTFDAGPHGVTGDGDFLPGRGCFVFAAVANVAVARTMNGLTPSMSGAVNPSLQPA